MASWPSTAIKNWLNNITELPYSFPFGEEEGTSLDIQNLCKDFEQMSISKSLKYTMMGASSESNKKSEFLWLTFLEFDLSRKKIDGLECRHLGLITKKPLPEIPEIKLFYKGSDFSTHLHNFETQISFSFEQIDKLSAYMNTVMKVIFNKEARCSTVDDPYYIVPFLRESRNINLNNPFFSIATIKDLFDWKEVANTINSKTSEFTLDKINCNLGDSVAIYRGYPLHRYQIKNISFETNTNALTPNTVKFATQGNITPSSTHLSPSTSKISCQEYPVIDARKMNISTDFLTWIRSGLHEKPEIELLSKPLSHFNRLFISLSVYKSLIAIPSIITRVDSLLQAKTFREKQNLDIDLPELLEALTSTSSQMEMNYERLEYLGDTLVKLIMAMYFFVSRPSSKEGKLTEFSQNASCNRNFCEIAKRINLDKYIVLEQFNVQKWNPGRFNNFFSRNACQKHSERRSPSDSTLADVIEAIIGASYLSGGLENALKTCINLQLPLDGLKSWSDFYVIYRNLGVSLPDRIKKILLCGLNYPKIVDIIGYEFKDPSLVLEALMGYNLILTERYNYQRLEFLGDAILDFFVNHYIFLMLPNASPETLTSIKSSIVSNKSLSIICFDLDLYRYIIQSQGQKESIMEYKELIQRVRMEGGDQKEVPKCKILADVVESIFGAVLVDSKFGLEFCEEVFKKWILPEIYKHKLLMHLSPHKINIPEISKFHKF